jgi:hypothetical protein
VGQLVFDGVDNDRNIESGVEYRPDALAIRSTALARDGDVVGLKVELDLVGIGKLPSGEDALDRLAKLEGRCRIWSDREGIAFASSWLDFDLGLAGKEFVAALVKVEDLGNGGPLRRIGCPASAPLRQGGVFT